MDKINKCKIQFACKCLSWEEHDNCKHYEDIEERSEDCNLSEKYCRFISYGQCFNPQACNEALEQYKAECKE